LGNTGGTKSPTSSGRLKECRRIGTRFEKLAVHFTGMLQLTMIQNCLKIAFSHRA
jgi:hypothetical protein